MASCFDGRPLAPLARAVAQVRNLRSGPLRTAIVLLLATVPWSVSAQITTQKESPSEFISTVRSCARTHAPEAQVAGVRTPEQAADYFFKVCVPVLGLLKDETSPPFGTIRAAVKEEWAAFNGRIDKR